MPYHFQQTPKILDTGIIKMQASVATALLLFSFFSPDYQNFNPPASFKILPLFCFCCCCSSSYLSWSIHQTNRSGQTAAPCSTSELVKRKLKRGGVGHSQGKKHRITQTEKNRQTASFRVRKETKWGGTYGTTQVWHDTDEGTSKSCPVAQVLLQPPLQERSGRAREEKRCERSKEGRRAKAHGSKTPRVGRHGMHYHPRDGWTKEGVGWGVFYHISNY